MPLTRRQFLTTTAAAGVAGAVGPSGVLDTTAQAASTLPPPAQSGIDHVVVVMMENRSFDHFLGWLPGADGRQSGLRYVDRYGVPHSTHHLRHFNSCGFNDPDHSYEGGRVELDHGRCDGWLRAGENDELSIGYYTKPDLAFFGQAATHWTACDQYFSAVMAETYPNRFYQHSAQTDRIHNSSTTSTLPAIWDLLANAGLTGRYYFSDIPFTALWGTKYADISKPFAQFQADALSGNLPQVSYVDPRFVDEASGTSSDDHPHADIRAGEMFLNQVYDAVRTSPNWKNTVLVINFDEWGGFFDHVAPGRAPDVSKQTSLRGFRVPALVISPRARRDHVAHRTYDHTSILRMIEWRWSLPALTPRDKNARNIAEVLDFSRPPNLASPTFDVPTIVPVACEASGASTAAEQAEWPALRRKAIDEGWSLPQ